MNNQVPVEFVTLDSTVTDQPASLYSTLRFGNWTTVCSTSLVSCRLMVSAAAAAAAAARVPSLA
jgi:hypothetical protein